jgi:hypothetical protein
VVGGPPVGTLGTPLPGGMVVVVAAGAVVDVVAPGVVSVLEGTVVVAPGTVVVAPGAVVVGAVVVATGAVVVVVPPSAAACPMPTPRVRANEATMARMSRMERRQSGNGKVNGLETSTKRDGTPAPRGHPSRTSPPGESPASAQESCSPHSVLSRSAHRPARASSPSATGRVHGQQPMDG